MRRFLHLERARVPREQAPAADAARRDRFGALPPEGAAPEPPVRAPVSHARFQAPPADEARPLRVREDDGGPAFVRCCRCRYDCQAFATRCEHCDADLATAEQRAYNEALWRRLQEERAELQREVERLASVRAAADAELRRALAEQERFFKTTDANRYLRAMREADGDAVRYELDVSSPRESPLLRLIAAIGNARVRRAAQIGLALAILWLVLVRPLLVGFGVGAIFGMALLVFSVASIRPARR